MRLSARSALTVPAPKGECHDIATAIPPPPLAATPETIGDHAVTDIGRSAQLATARRRWLRHSPAHKCANVPVVSAVRRGVGGERDATGGEDDTVIRGCWLVGSALAKVSGRPRQLRWLRDSQP